MGYEAYIYNSLVFKTLKMKLFTTITVLLFFCGLTNLFAQACPTQPTCTSTMTASNNANFTVNSGDVLCLDGTATGVNVTLNGGTVVLLDGADVTIQNFNANSSNSVLYVSEGATLRAANSLQLNSNLRTENCGSVSAPSGINIDGVFNNYPGATVGINGTKILGANAVFTNDDTLCITNMNANTLQLNATTNLILNCYFRAKGNVRLDADVDIDGILVIEGNLSTNSNVDITSDDNPLKIYVDGNVEFSSNISFATPTIICASGGINFNNSSLTTTADGDNLTVNTGYTGFSDDPSPVPSPEDAPNNCTLPVELLSFNAKTIDESVQLSWATASESNNEGFEIERSPNTKDWETIDFVTGQGNSLEVINYIYADNTPLQAINYYRLKQMDFDGSFEYSEIVSINLKDKTPEIEVYPNPTRAFINFNTTSKIRTLKVMDITGNLLITKVYDSANQVELDVSQLIAGNYFTVLQFDEAIEIVRFVKM